MHIIYHNSQLLLVSEARETKPAVVDTSEPAAP